MADSILLVVDMLSPYDFPGAETVAEQAPEVVEGISECRTRAAGDQVPVVFANDIHDSFSGSRESIFAAALEGNRPELVRPVEPAKGDAFMHKGQHSAFFGTPLAHLLLEWEVEELVLVGQITEQCVLYTALDAHVRHYGVTVLTDCVLHGEPDLGAAAFRMMESNMGARLLSRGEWAEKLGTG